MTTKDQLFNIDESQNVGLRRKKRNRMVSIVNRSRNKRDDYLYCRVKSYASFFKHERETRRTHRFISLTDHSKREQTQFKIDSFDSRRQLTIDERTRWILKKTNLMQNDRGSWSKEPRRTSALTSRFTFISDHRQSDREERLKWKKALTSSDGWQQNRNKPRLTWENVDVDLWHLLKNTKWIWKRSKFVGMGRGSSTNESTLISRMLTSLNIDVWRLFMKSDRILRIFRLFGIHWWTNLEELPKWRNKLTFDR